MLQRILSIALCVSLLLLVLAREIHNRNRIETLELENAGLRKTIETNTKATKEKEQRNATELSKLKKEIEKIKKLDSSWASVELSDDALKFLQELADNSNGTLSIIIAK